MIILIFLYGIIIGSFLNVCIYRIPRGESVAFPPSHCTSCGTNLKWYDNIPLFSYIALRGRCRYCATSISSQYPLIEAINGVLYILLYMYFGLSINFVFYALISSVLLVIYFIDLFEMIIPDGLIIIIFALEIIHKFLLYYFKSVNIEFLDIVLGFVLPAILFILIIVLSNGGMGDGDVTLISAVGFILGFKKVILNIFLSFFIGAIISLLLLASKIKSKKDPIPFGPFIIIAFFITLLFGDNIINWYLRYF